MHAPGGVHTFARNMALHVFKPRDFRIVAVGTTDLAKSRFECVAVIEWNPLQQQAAPLL